MSEEMGIFETMYNCRAMRRLDKREVPQESLEKLIERRTKHLLDQIPRTLAGLSCADLTVKQAELAGTLIVSVSRIIWHR